MLISENYVISEQYGYILLTKLLNFANNLILQGSFRDHQYKKIMWDSKFKCF